MRLNCIVNSNSQIVHSANYEIENGKINHGVIPIIRLGNNIEIDKNPETTIGATIKNKESIPEVESIRAKMVSTNDTTAHKTKIGIQTMIGVRIMAIIKSFLESLSLKFIFIVLTIWSLILICLLYGYF